MLKVFLAGAIRRVTEEKRMLTYLLVLGSPGLIIVDHIHFQYNGMLLGSLVACQTHYSIFMSLPTLVFFDRVCLN